MPEVPVPRIVYEDEQIVVVVKPAGVLSQPDETGDAAVADRVAEMLGDASSFLAPVHRLDRPVSGLLLLARDAESARSLSESFRERQVQKRYLAVVEGEWEGGGLLRDYLVRSGRDARVVAGDDAGSDAKEARLQYRVLASGDGTALVDAHLKTGRRHQVRVQMASAKHPIVGDKRYGASTGFEGRSIALHAYRLQFRHPARPELMDFAARPPETWRAHHRAAWIRLIEPLTDRD